MFRVLLTCFALCIFAQEKGPKGSQERWENVLNWLKPRVPSIHVDSRIVMRPGRFGDQVLSAGDKINKDEFLLQLPVQTFFWDEDCFPSKEFAQLRANYSSSLKQFPDWKPSLNQDVDYTQTAICLLIHRLLGNQSIYEPYIRQLPRQAEAFMFHSPDTFEVLRGTDTYRMVKAMERRHLAILDNAPEKVFPMIRKYLPNLNVSDSYLREEFEQALSLCGSRTFYMDSEMLAPGQTFSFGKFYRPVMVPLIDFVNHGDMRTRNCEYYFNRTHQHFQLRTIRSIEPGEELVMSYGLRANWELLIFYGFLMPGNEDDFVNVLDLGKHALDYHFQLRLIEREKERKNNSGKNDSSSFHSMRCFSPFFLPASAWPPVYHTTIKNASPNTRNTPLSLGPLNPAVYRTLFTYLQPPHNLSVKNGLMSLAADNEKTVLRVSGGQVNIAYQNGSELHNYDNETLGSHGDLNVILRWKLPSVPSDCTSTRKSDYSLAASDLYRCQDAVQSPNQTHTSSSPVGLKCAARDEDEELREEFRLRRRVIRAARLDALPDKIFRNGLMPQSLAAVKIAALPYPLTAYDVHRILSGAKQSSDLGISRALTVFCFEELSRRLQVLGVETAEELRSLLEQSRALPMASSGAYEQLARNDLEILTDFCSLIADWQHSVWD